MYPNKSEPILVVTADAELAERLLISLHRDLPDVTLFHVVDVPKASDFIETRSPGCIFLDTDLRDGAGDALWSDLVRRASAYPVIAMGSLSNEGILARYPFSQECMVKSQFGETCLKHMIRFARERRRSEKRLESVMIELAELKGRVDKLSMVDSLTDLLNRRGLQDVFVRELEILRRDNTGLIMLTVDIDNFDGINQSLGHAAGDVILREIAGRIRKTLRMSDYVARVGSDEFILLLPGTRLAEGIRVAEKVRLAISQMSVSMNSAREVHVTASLGIAVANANTLSLDRLMAKTRRLLYHSKSEGKNRVAYENQSGTSDGSSGHLDEIRMALQRGDRFHALKQPIVDLRDGKSIGYEFLSRSMVSGFEMPDDFFRLSMEANMLTVVDRHCFQTCVEASLPLDSQTSCHFNIFPSTLMDFSADHFLDAMKPEKGGHKYCIEISEQQIIGDPSYLARTVKTFKDRGVLIAIDDVGFGRSCLESLVLLEPDIVKIDKKWVMGVQGDEMRRHSLQRILKVSSVLGCEVVAEGIESRAELDVLRGMGVTYGQGYFFGRPG